ncbi:ABC transporter ATP-binding protein [Actinomadura graeca]|uniref:ABC transporter ATP-binding protein n=1 Tax=Actinomadura graeca TaxID=2750812 RepID=A0ABX8QYC6_9ACTN|nr:ABC transporter ATP-binding protein [Actinomadura graeca]QXJ23841.1 ABC transporter ATP-binding protein [Actinomadura graeca]
MIEIEEVSKVYERDGHAVHALERVDLEVKEGEFVTLLGRSGCGKSTLLRSIAGLERPTSGRVSIRGERVDKPRRDVGIMFQKTALLPWRNVIENVLLPVEIMRRKSAASRARALELLETAGLKGFENRRPGELSGGMQQRVSLCRSLIHDPDVLLMDEPFAALDALTREELTGELQRICEEQGKTVVFVTHSIDDAVMLADRTVVMTPRPGRVSHVVHIDAVRPRSLGHSEQSGYLAERRRLLHDMLFERSRSGT